jgi:hypothetical protein
MQTDIQMDRETDRERQADRQIDMTKQIVAFHNFANAPQYLCKTLEEPHSSSQQSVTTGTELSQFN